MLEPLLIAVMLLAAAGCGWSYVQMQRSDARRTESDAALRDSARLMGELADELSAAGQYLYDAMDECNAKIDGFERKWAERITLLEAAQATPVPAPPAQDATPQPAPVQPAPIQPAARESAVAEFPVAESAVAEEPLPAAAQPVSASPARQVTASKMAAYRRAAYVQPRPQPSPEEPAQTVTPGDFAALLSAMQQADEAAAPAQMEPEPEPEAQPAQGVYHPHFHALELASQGADMIEIARQTGLGTEELRLLLRFREALSVG